MKTELSTVEKIRKVLGMPVDLAEMKLEDGVTIIEAEVFEAGQPVNVKTEDGQLIPLPVNAEGYKLEDGMLLVVTEEGIIAEIKEAGSEAPEMEKSAPLEQQDEEVATSETPTETPVAKKVVESVSKETYFTQELHDSMVSEIAELKAQIEELTKEETVEKTEEVTEEVELSTEEEVKPIQYNPENSNTVESVFKIAANRKPNVHDRVRSQIFGK
jgi:hypothetical protein